MELLEFIRNNKVTFLDGGMGTILERRNVPGGGSNNLSHPDDITAVHKEYVNIGSDIIISNSFTLNRIYMESHKINIDIKEANHAAVKNAQNARKEGTFVLGDIGPTGRMLAPMGKYTEEEFIDNFKEQALLLAECGVDGFIVETMMDLEEAKCAVKACKMVAQIPVFASMTYTTSNNGGATIMGNTAEQCAIELEKAGADVIGANCGDLSPSQMGEIIKIYKTHSELPIFAEPNAGLPQLIDGETVFTMSPEDYTVGAEECIWNGAKIIGGCCGTTPAHIAAVKKMIS